MGNPILECEHVDSDCESGAPPSPVDFFPPTSIARIEARILYFRMTTDRISALNRYIIEMRALGMPISDANGVWINYSLD